MTTHISAVEFIKKHKLYIIFWASVLVTLVYTTLFTSEFAGDLGDDGLILTGATRIMAGDLIYRDWYSWITPGTYYLLVWAWKIFGVKYIVSRILTIIIGFLIAIYIYKTCRVILNRAWASINVIIFVIFFYPIHLILSYHWIALFFILLNADFVNKFIKDRQNKHLVYSGLTLGLGVFFLHTTIIFAGLANVFFIVWLHWRREQRKYIFKKVALFILPLLIVSATALSFFIIQAGPSLIWRDIILHNYLYYPAINGAPFFAREYWWLNLYAMSLLALIIFSNKYFIKTSSVYHNISFYFFTSLFIFLSVTYNFDAQHLAYTYNMFTLALIIYTISALFTNKKLFFYYKILWTFFLIAPISLYLGALSVFLNDNFKRSSWQPISSHIGKIYLPSGEMSPPNSEQALSVLTLTEIMNDKYVFFYPYHSLYYALSGKKNPTRYEMIFQKMLSAKNQVEIQNDLINKNVNYVFYFPYSSNDSQDLTKWLKDNYNEQIIYYSNTGLYYYLFTKK